MEYTTLREQPLGELVAVLLIDLAHMNRSQRTRHAYATDLAQLCAFYQARASEHDDGGGAAEFL